MWSMWHDVLPCGNSIIDIALASHDPYSPILYSLWGAFNYLITEHYVLLLDYFNDSSI